MFLARERERVLCRALWRAHSVHTAHARAYDSYSTPTGRNCGLSTVLPVPVGIAILSGLPAKTLSSPGLGPARAAATLCLAARADAARGHAPHRAPARAVILHYLPHLSQQDQIRFAAHDDLNVQLVPLPRRLDLLLHNGLLVVFERAPKVHLPSACLLCEDAGSPSCRLCRMRPRRGRHGRGLCG